MNSESKNQSYHLVFDGFPSPDGPRFIELEDDSGRSIKAGEWKKRADGLAELVLPCTPAPETHTTGDYHELLMRLQAVQHGTDRPYAASVAKDAGDAIKALTTQPRDGGRWRVIEAATAPGYWGIELEDAGNDDDAILYPQKIHRDTVARIVEAHNAALATTEGQPDA